MEDAACGGGGRTSSSNAGASFTLAKAKFPGSVANSAPKFSFMRLSLAM
jgi:hypothetical protein